MDDALFAAGYNGGFGTLVARAYALTGDLDAARSLVQEAYVRAAVRRREFDDAEDVEAFLWTTVGALHESRWLGKHPAPFGNLSVPGKGPSPARMALQADLNAMTAPARRALIDRDLFGWTVHDTARDLGTSTAAVHEFWRQGQDVIERHSVAWLEAAHPIPSAPLPYAALVREGRGRAQRRSGILVGITAAALLAVVGAGIAAFQKHPGASTNSSDGASPSSCAMPTAWRAALTPDGPAWLNAHALTPTAQGFAAMEYDGAFDVLRWHPQHDGRDTVELDRGRIEQGAAVALLSADDGYVLWAHGNELRLWDGRTTEVLGSGGMSATVVDGAVVWAGVGDVDADHTVAWQLHRYDLTTRSSTLLREFRMSDHAYLELFDGYAAVHTPDGLWEFTDLAGTSLAHVSDTGLHPIGTYDGSPLWASGATLMTLRDGRVVQLWRRTTADPAGVHGIALAQTSFASGFLLYSTGTALGVLDLRTRHFAEVPHYTQLGQGWEAEAILQAGTGMLAYYGFDQTSGDAARAAASTPTSTTTRGRFSAATATRRPGTPDGGPRFTPLASLPRIDCGAR